MTDPLDIGPDHGRRALWLFALHVSNDDLGHWEPPRPNAPRDWPLEAALGVGKLEPGHVQVFEVDDLGKYGLRKYLTEANGMDPEEVDADAANLDRLHGTAVVVFDNAVVARPARFDPQKPLRFIGHYRAPVALTPAHPELPNAATRGHIPGPSGPPADSRMLNRASAITLAVLALGALALAALALA